MDERIDFVEKIIKKVDEQFLGNHSVSRISYDRKSDTSFLTQQDKNIEKFLVSELQKMFPGDGFIGEEGDSIQSSTGFSWVIDPIDGTTNFVYRQPIYTTSVGLTYQGEIVGGIINVPALGKLYSTVKGCGFQIRGEPFSVSSTNTLAQSFAIYSIGHKPYLKENNLKLYPIVLNSVSRLRIFGSPSYELTQVASGLADILINVGASPWDVAAGVAIAREAGAMVKDFHGNDWNFESKELVAGNEMLVAEFLEVVNNSNYFL